METCNKCNLHERVPKQRWCKKCRAEWMRHNRKPLNDEQRRKANARSYAKVYLRRGKLQRRPCEVCGSRGEEMHHDDYGQPLKVRWFCRKHHLAHHQEK